MTPETTVTGRGTVPSLMALLGLMLLVTGAARAEPLAQAVVTHSPLGEISRHYPAMVRQGIRDGLVASGHVEAGLADSVAGLASLAFSGPRMRARLAADLQAGLSDNELTAVLDWYQSPLGRRLAASEADAAAPEAWGALAERGPELMNRARGTGRVTLFRRYDQALQATSRSIALAESAQKQLIPAYRSVMGASAPDSEILARQIEEHRPLVREQIAEQVYVAFLNTYASYSDEELTRYLAFLESGPGQAYARVAGDTIAAGLLEPLQAVSGQMARFLGRGR